MNKKYGFLVCCFIVLLFAACSKDSITELSTGSVSIQGYSSTTDTLVKEMPLVTDSVITFKLGAMLNGQPATSDHYIRFAVDTSKIALYREKYGDAFLLPDISYFFFKSDCYIRAGSTLSDSIAMNIVQENSLRPYSTYVLPLVIQSVNGQKNAVAPGEVMYLVFKAGKASVIGKAEWKIVSVSSEWEPGMAVEAIDNILTTGGWASDPYGSMPQNIVIDFGYPVTFSAVTDHPRYYEIGQQGGVPTKVKIELSMDGTSWTDKGTFDLEHLEEQVIDMGGECTAQYMRFTVLEATLMFGAYEAVYLTEIGLNP